MEAANELRAWQFCDPDQAAQRFSPLLRRRVAVALAARTRGHVSYLEDGDPVHPTEGRSA